MRGPLGLAQRVLQTWEGLTQGEQGRACPAPGWVGAPRLPAQGGQFRERQAHGAPGAQHPRTHGSHGTHRFSRRRPHRREIPGSGELGVTAVPLTGRT